MKHVPCDGCVLCCTAGAVRVLPDEPNDKFKTQEHPFFAGARMIARKANGECTYLVNGACSVHDDKPLQCQQLDCREIARHINLTKARHLTDRGYLSFDVWARGRELLHEERK